MLKEEEEEEEGDEDDEYEYYYETEEEVDEAEVDRAVDDMTIPNLQDWGLDQRISGRTFSAR